jgi:hypothetical protein
VPALADSHIYIYIERERESGGRERESSEPWPKVVTGTTTGVYGASGVVIAYCTSSSMHASTSARVPTDRALAVSALPARRRPDIAVPFAGACATAVEEKEREEETAGMASALAAAACVCVGGRIAAPPSRLDVLDVLPTALFVSGAASLAPDASAASRGGACLSG